MDSTKKYKNPSPEVTTNFLSKLFFCWVLPFLKYGYKHGLQIKDIYNTTDGDLSGPLGDNLEKNWNYEMERATQKKQKPSLKRAIFKTFGKSYGVYGIYLFIQVIILRTIHPLVLAQYIRYFDESSSESDPLRGWLLASGVILISFLNVVIYHHCCMGCQRIGMRVRIACCSLVYRKLLKLNQTSLGQTAAGQLVNLLSNDVQRFDYASNFLHFIWIMPIQCATGLYVMYNSVGLAAFAGMAAMAIEAIPLQGYLAKLQGQLRSKIAHKTDYRVKLMSEIVSGIQVIKMYAWEKSFEKVVALARKLEIDKITWASFIRGLYLGLTIFTDRLCLYLSLITYVLMGNRLTGDIVFSMAQLFNTVQLYMAIYYPCALSGYAEAKVSMKRLEEFLFLEENESKIPAITNGTMGSMQIEKPGKIKMYKLNASWVENAIVDTLLDINLEIKPGTLCCVVGNVGSGKSSLLQTILKELPPTKGSLDVTGKIAYASQEPWLFVSSVRNNILFGKSYVKPRYHEVIKVCALERDFKQFPFGDKTLVGERGVSLSGGQRARINLARAVYSEADIYLLDDPLSAVDTHVGKHLFNECIMKYLGNKTRILVTHQLQFLKKSDLIVVMNNGKIESVGTFNELGENQLRHYSQVANEDKEVKIEKFVKKERMHSVASFQSVSSILTEFEEPQETQELVEKGTIPVSTYTEYYRSGGSIPLLIFAGLFLLVAQMASNAADLWVTHWTNMEDLRYESYSQYWSLLTRNDVNDLINGTASPTNISLWNTTNSRFLNNTVLDDPVSQIPPKEWYIVIYSIFIAAAVILTPLSRNVLYIIYMRSSKNLHNIMFGNILQAPMRFFDTNPSGRILNRFSKDMGTIDEILPRAFTEAIQVFLVMGGILMLVFIVSPWMIVPAVILGFIFYVCEVIYLGTAQDIKRLEGVTRAPVFSHISASLYGLSTIRASHAEQMIITEFDTLQDQHTSTWYLMLASSETFGFYLDVISVIFLSCVTFQYMVFGDGNSADVGLVISQAMVLTGMLQLGPRATAEVASNMTSVERVLQYSKLEKEGPFESLPANKPPRDWPHKGKIVFKNTYLRYDVDAAPALRNLNVTIQPSEKVGIVGRTGAGKSTLIASLFRLAPIDGIISIDDVDTATVGLNDLRSNISIIPQEPVLFSASIRYNLDPFSKVTDEVLWDALEKVELKSSIESLDLKVSEGGSNFSAGQRQLVCLARAIVRNNKVLVMDEATANVDHVTDSLIQKTIRENFKDCTVLTIAHRLNTIMDSDKVLVMDNGEAVEFGHPHELLKNPEGYFTKMVKETGPTMEANLRKVAKEDYESKF